MHVRLNKSDAHLFMPRKKGEGNCGPERDEEREGLDAKLDLYSMDPNLLCFKLVFGEDKPNVSFLLRKPDLIKLREMLNKVIHEERD
jgi:hypothetical protein